MTRSSVGMGFLLFFVVFFLSYVSLRYFFATFVPVLCEGSSAIGLYEIPCAGLLPEALSVGLGLLSGILVFGGSRKAAVLAVLPG